MAKPERKLPTCGTCPHGLPIETNDTTLICHGAPPTAVPISATTTDSHYPPVAVDKIGCGLHPKWPKR